MNVKQPGILLFNSLFFITDIAVFDSWTKFQSGVLFGNTIDFGNYEQCIDFKFESKDMDIGMIEGKHCMIFYRSTTNASSPELTDGIFDWTEM